RRRGSRAGPCPRTPGRAAAPRSPGGPARPQSRRPSSTGATNPARRSGRSRGPLPSAWSHSFRVRGDAFTAAAPSTRPPPPRQEGHAGGSRYLRRGSPPIGVDPPAAPGTLHGTLRPTPRGSFRLPPHRPEGPAHAAGRYAVLFLDLRPVL